MKYRLSISGLMAFVLVAAVGFAGLRSASALWASAIFTLTVAVLATATLGAMAARGRARITWAGFAVFGWVYLGTTFGLWWGQNGVVAPPFLTKPLLDRLQPSVATPGVMTIDPGPQGEAEVFLPPPLLPSSGSPPGGSPPFAPLPFAGRVVNLRHYRQIGHCLAAILFGIIGAVIGRAFRDPGDGAGH